METCVALCGVSVDLCANAIDFVDDVECAAFCRALEHHVLDKWEIPAFSGVSLTTPAPTNTPIATDLTAVFCTNTSFNPLLNSIILHTDIISHSFKLAIIFYGMSETRFRNFAQILS